METKLELSDAYRKSRGSVSIFSGIALAWAGAQFEFSMVKLPFFGDVNLSQYSIPMILAVSILYSMTRCTTEFMMQSVEVRRWKLAQFDYKMTLIFSSITIPLLAVSGVSRSLKTIIVVLGIGLALALTFLAASFLMTMCFMPLRLFFWRKRREHPPVAVAAFEATSYGFLFSGLGILAIIAAGGSKLLFSSYEFFGLTEAPETLPVLIFIVTCMLFVLGCFYHHQFLLKVFAFEPEFNVKTFKQKDGSTLVHFERNDKKDKNS